MYIEVLIAIVLMPILLILAKTKINIYVFIKFLLLYLLYIEFLFINSINTLFLQYGITIILLFVTNLIESIKTNEIKKNITINVLLILFIISYLYHFLSLPSNIIYYINEVAIFSFLIYFVWNNKKYMNNGYFLLGIYLINLRQLINALYQIVQIFSD